MDIPSYNSYLRKQCDPEEIIELSKIVFVEGHLERIDDLLISILPLANIVYYKYIRNLDDREYAREDLISDAVLRLYQDMTLRWDKYIRIESYYTYYSTLLKNGMIGLVHEYHNYYSVDELDLDSLNSHDNTGEKEYIDLEYRLLKESIKKDIISTAEHLLECRGVNTNLLLSILDYSYLRKEDLSSLRSRVRVLGISNSLFNFYCEHVTYIYRLSLNYHYAQLGGRKSMIQRISNTIDRFEDVTYRMLSVNYYDSILPEIYAEFGADIAKRFVKTFGNRTIQVPDYRSFCDNLLGGVVLSLADGDKSNLYRVAEEYHIPFKSLSRIYNNASKYELGKRGAMKDE